MQTIVENFTDFHKLTIIDNAVHTYSVEKYCHIVYKFYYDSIFRVKKSTEYNYKRRKDDSDEEQYLDILDRVWQKTIWVSDTTIIYNWNKFTQDDCLTQ